MKKTDEDAGEALLLDEPTALLLDWLDAQGVLSIEETVNQEATDPRSS